MENIAAAKALEATTGLQGSLSDHDSRMMTVEMKVDALEQAGNGMPTGGNPGEAIIVDPNGDAVWMIPPTYDDTALSDRVTATEAATATNATDIANSAAALGNLNTEQSRSATG